MTKNRRSQGWEEEGLRRSRRGRLVQERTEMGLAELPLAVDPIPVEPLPIVLGGLLGSGERIVERSEDEAVGSQDAPGRDASSEGEGDGR